MSTNSTTGETRSEDFCGKRTNCHWDCSYWVRHDGREFITDPNGEVVNLARLTAYAEYGDKIHEAEAHHRMPLLKIDAPRFIVPLTKEEHGKLHGRKPEPVEVDGFPMILEE